MCQNKCCPWRPRFGTQSCQHPGAVTAGLSGVEHCAEGQVYSPLKTKSRLFWNVLSAITHSASTSSRKCARKSLSNLVLGAQARPADTNSWCLNVTHTQREVWKHNRLHTYVSTWTWAGFFFFFFVPVKDRRGRRRRLHFPHYVLGRLPKSSGAQRASPPFKGVEQIVEKPCSAACTETGTADVKHTVSTPQNQTVLHLSW